MRLPKTRYKRFEIRNFSGGLNTEQVDTKINEFIEFHNILITTNGARLRGGFRVKAAIADVVQAFYNNGI